MRSFSSLSGTTFESCSISSLAVIVVAFSGEGRNLIPHVLCMACVDHCDGVAFDRVGEVPPVGISHVVACPLGDGRLATEEGALDLEDRENCILNISL